ncbi:glutathione S-transferase [Bosea sp. AK1]|uniref:glutathione S-transferase family protein n=1 Tax=Bosea sp. AK1 TaxID=2587160 RepID=UPI00116E34BA|nr:glutathione S-transferase family protein [Bosea sp. AK1]TQI75092.1 glutathione S-transferase [Bosea sp. AK1]
MSLPPTERLTLHSQSHSPYARKTIVFAHEAGIAERLAIIDQETSPTNRNPDVFAVNPLGKVPVLITPEAGAIFDSLVICDYLDGLHGGRRLIPAEGKARWQALRLHAIAQGLCDAGIALRWETLRRPEHLRYPPLSEGQTAKLVESFDLLERSESFDEPVHIGHIGLATALAWLEFRDLPDFRIGRPRLTRWHKAFSARPSMRATAYHGETQDRPAARAIAG